MERGHAMSVAIVTIPAQVLADNRAQAGRAMAAGKPVNRAAAVVVVAIWLLLAALVGMVAYRAVRLGPARYQ